MSGPRGIRDALPLLLIPILAAAGDLDSAARDLAHRIPTTLRSPISLSVRNLSDLAPQDLAILRRALESELRARGISTAEGGTPDEIRVSLSQNLTGYLVVAEIRHGEERQVILVPMPAPQATPRAGPAVAIEKVLLTRQPDPILDIAAADSDLLVLQPARILRLTQENGRWATRESAPLTLSLPRDPRGRLVVQGGSYLAYLPGAICSGAVTPLDARCRDADEAWPLAHDPALRANFARGRNYFDGRASTPGATKSIPAFYSAAAAGDPVAKLWIFTRLDGRAWLHDSSLEALAGLGAWGSDIAALACGSSNLILASRPAAGSEKDSLRVFQIADRQPVEAAPAIDLPGPVTALWPAGENSAIAVARDLTSGDYAAYRLATNCH